MRISNLLLSLFLVAIWAGLDQPVVSAQAQEAAPPTPARKGNGLRGPAQKELIYVTLPGSLERSPDQNGNGIVVA